MPFARRKADIHNRIMPDSRLSERDSSNRLIFNRTTAQGEWQRRIARAEELGAQYSFAAEILRFYAAIARFQKDFSAELGRSPAAAGAAGSQEDPFARPLQAGIEKQFNKFLSVVEQNGPDPLQEPARDLRRAGADSQLQLLTLFWETRDSGSLSSGSTDFFARAFL